MIVLGLIKMDKPKSKVKIERIWNIQQEHGTAILEQKSKNNNYPSVLFLHGFASNRDVWFKWEDSMGRRALKKDKYDVYTLDMTNSYFGNIKELSKDLFYATKIIHENDSLIGKKTKIKIVAHSMGGIVARFMLNSDNFKSKVNFSSWISDVNLLAVPNHGIKASDNLRILDIISKMQNIVDKRNMQTAFQQLEAQSSLIKSLNKKGNSLSSSVMWKNAIGLNDDVVNKETAEFKEDELPKNCELEQKYFNVNHMVYPFSTTLKRLSLMEGPSIIDPLIEPITELFKNQQYPAIHRSKEVYEWIFNKKAIK